MTGSDYHHKHGVDKVRMSIMKTNSDAGVTTLSESAKGTFAKSGTPSSGRPASGDHKFGTSHDLHFLVSIELAHHVWHEERLTEDTVLVDVDRLHNHPVDELRQE